MSAHHDHHHSHQHTAPFKVLIIGVVLALGYALIEAIAGFYANSLALLSDAGHMAADGASLLLAAIAAWIAEKPPTERFSYGLGRAEVLGAWISSLGIVLIAIFIVIEAIERLRVSANVQGATIIWVSLLAIIVNLIIAWVLNRGEKNLNLRAASAHVLSDLLGSVAALIAGLLIYFFHWQFADSLLSFVICALMFIISFRLLKETMHVLMESVPAHINLEQVGSEIAVRNKVIAVHDLHIWALSSKTQILSAHIEIEHMDDWPQILDDLKHFLHEKYKIDHITLQPEPRAQTLKHLRFDK